jgi:glycosyltransferase involved in cell wall biosynthesis
MRQRWSRWRVQFGSRQPAVISAAWHPLAPDLVAEAATIAADLYIAHYPTALAAAALAAQRNGGLYAYDAEDFHLGDKPEGAKHALEREMIRAIEGRYLPGSAYVTAATCGIADAYVAAYGIERPTIVLNVFPRANAPVAPTTLGTILPGPSVYWFSQTIGPDRGLECAVRAISRAASQPHLYLRGTAAKSFIDQLRLIAAKVGVADRLHFLPPAAPSEMERLAAAHDVGLVGETGHTPNRRIALTNKLFSYLLAGVPVVMSDIPAHSDLIRKLGAAARLYRTDDAEQLAAMLDALLLDKAVLADARKAAFHLGQTRFNWDMEKVRLINCVASSLGTRRMTQVNTALGAL